MSTSGGVNIATLGVRLDANQAITDANRLGSSLEDMGTKGETAAASVSKIRTAHNEGASAAEHHAFATGKAIRALEGLSVEAVGANHQLATLGVVAGEYAAGNIAVLGSLVALGVGGKIYETLTEEEHKAREEQEKLTKALGDWYEKQKEGAAGELPKQIEATKKKIVELREELEKMNKGGISGAVQAGKSIGMAGWLRTIMGGDPTAIATQFSIEVGKAHAKIAGTIKEGGDAIDAANKEVASRIEADALKQAEERWKAVSYELGMSLDNLQALLDTSTKIAAQLKETGVEWTINAKNYQSIVDIQKIAIEGWDKEKNAIAARNKEITDKQLKTAATENSEIAKRMLGDVQRDFATFFDGIMTKGISSFGQFFSELKSMFLKMLAEMEAAALMKKIKPALAGMLGIPMEGAPNASTLGKYQTGIAALGIGAAGFGVGSMIGGLTTNSAVGALGGAASGAATGAAIGAMGGPIGVVAGGIIGAGAGLIGGFLGARHSAEALAQEQLKLKMAQSQIAASLADWRAEITGTAEDQKAAAIADLRWKYLSIRQTIEQVEAGKKMEEQRNKDLAEADALYKQAMDQLTNKTYGLADAMTGAINAVNGYRYQVLYYGSMPITPPGVPSGSSGGSGGGGGGGGGGGTDGGGTELTVNLVADGAVLATTVVRNLKMRAARQLGDPTRWGEVQIQ